MFCGSGLLLVLVVGYLITARNRRAAQAVPPVAAADAPAAPLMSDDFGDLPDLDVLASTEALRIDPETDTEVSPAPMPPAGAQRISLAEGEAVEAVEVFTVLRDVAEGGLIIRIGDQAYRNPPAVADADFKRRFHTVLRDLAGAQQPVEAKPKPSTPKAATAEVPAEASDAMPTFAADEPIPGDLPKFKLPDKPVKPKRGQRPVAEPIPEINIAAAIESFLQHKLTHSSEYAERSIHVRPALHGGVTIEVDGTFYETVGEVADEEVRDYLTATIAEWQARQ